MANDHDLLLTNDKVKRIIHSRDFFSNLRVLAFVLDPLRKAVLSLESKKASLSDCFLSLARLAAALKKLPRSFNVAFRNHCARVINQRYDEFDEDVYLACFFLDPRYRGAPLKDCAIKRVLRSLGSIGKRLGFDRYEADFLCIQIEKYKEGKEPFDLDIGYAKDGPLKWWNYISTDPEPDVLPKLACHLFAICPNSASCERGFSTLGWLFHKRRLNLNLERLESMCKMILYWKSNSRSELGFYGIDQKKNIRLSDEDINIRIAEAFAEVCDEEYSDEQTSAHRLTTSGEIIPEDNCRVVIELQIDKYIDLSHSLIANEIGEVPEDILDDLDDLNENNTENDEVNNVGINDDRVGVGDFDYDIDDILGINNDEEDVMIDSEK